MIFLTVRGLNLRACLPRVTVPLAAAPSQVVNLVFVSKLEDLVSYLSISVIAVITVVK